MKDKELIKMMRKNKRREEKGVKPLMHKGRMLKGRKLEIIETKILKKQKILLSEEKNEK